MSQSYRPDDSEAYKETLVTALMESLMECYGDEAKNTKRWVSKGGEIRDEEPTGQVVE